MTDGTVFCSGYNKFGELGIGSMKKTTVFEEIRGISSNISQIASGNFHTMILLTDGRLLGYGYNYFGQLGLGDTKNRSVFEKITNARRLI